MVIQNMPNIAYLYALLVFRKQESKMSFSKKKKNTKKFDNFNVYYAKKYLNKNSWCIFIKRAWILLASQYICSISLTVYIATRALSPRQGQILDKEIYMNIQS